MVSFASLRFSVRIAALAVDLAVAACAGPAVATAAPAVEGPFVGTLPCADCEGIRTELTLLRDPGSGCAWLGAGLAPP